MKMSIDWPSIDFLHVSMQQLVESILATDYINQLPINYQPILFCMVPCLFNCIIVMSHRPMQKHTRFYVTKNNHDTILPHLHFDNFCCRHHNTLSMRNTVHHRVHHICTATSPWTLQLLDSVVFLLFLETLHSFYRSNDVTWGPSWTEAGQMEM